MPTFTNYDALNDFIFEDMKKQIKDYIDNAEFEVPDDCVWSEIGDDIINELTEWTCYPSFEINFDFPQFAIVMNKLNDMERIVGGEFEYTDALLTNLVLGCIYNENVEALDEYATALCEEKQIILRREAEEEDERREAEYKERSGEQIREMITRAYAEGGIRFVAYMVSRWMEEEMDEERHKWIKENVEIACERVGIDWKENVEKIYQREIEEKQKEKEFIENFKKTTMGVIEVMLEKIDEKKQNMKEYDYMEYMKHLKMAWEMVEEVKNKEEALKSKEIVNDFWKCLSQKLCK